MFQFSFVTFIAVDKQHTSIASIHAVADRLLTFGTALAAKLCASIVQKLDKQ